MLLCCHSLRKAGIKKLASDREEREQRNKENEARGEGKRERKKKRRKKVTWLRGGKELNPHLSIPELHGRQVGFE